MNTIVNSLLLSSLLALPSIAFAQQKKAPARSLDVALLRESPGLVSFLCRKKYRAVGVLPFQVRKGKGDAAYDGAPLAAGLPVRLENALLMCMDADEGKALRVIRDAAEHASAQKVGAWATDKAAFAKLFTAAYPLAWGDETHKPDVLLTGVVSSAADRVTTTVEIVGLTKADWADGKPKPFALTTLEVRTDRALLRDLGYNYALPRNVIKRGVSAEARDEQAVEQEKGPTPGDIAGVRFELFYDGKAQAIRPAKESGNVFEVATAQVGAKVKMALTRTSGEGGRLGAVIKVNGVSIYKKDRRDSMQCPKWLFDASDKGTRYEYRGFQMDAKGKELYPFEVLAKKTSDARAAELGERAGWIDIDVFAAGEEPQEEEQALVSTRGMPKGKKPAKLADLREQLLARNHVRVKKSEVKRRAPGGLIVADLEAVPGQKLAESELKNPVRIAGVSIRYHDRSGD